MVGGYWVANRNRMFPISILLVSAEVGEARLRVKPGDDSRASVELIGKCSQAKLHVSGGERKRQGGSYDQACTTPEIFVRRRTGGRCNRPRRRWVHGAERGDSARHDGGGPDLRSRSAMAKAAAQ